MKINHRVCALWFAATRPCDTRLPYCHGQLPIIRILPDGFIQKWKVFNRLSQSSTTSAIKTVFGTSSFLTVIRMIGISYPTQKLWINYEKSPIPKIPWINIQTLSLLEKGADHFFIFILSSHYKIQV